MGDDRAWRAAVGILVLLVVTMRLCFTLLPRGRRLALLPDNGAVEWEGTPLIFLRAVSMFLFFGAVGLYLSGERVVGGLKLPIPAQLRQVGFVAGLLAVALWTWAQVHLGRQWSAQLTLQAGHRLVTSGPYRWVRHPLYSGLFLWALCLAVVAANALLAAVDLFVVVVMACRVPREECMMIGLFGNDYIGYMERTGRYFPRLFRGHARVGGR